MAKIVLGLMDKREEQKAWLNNTSLKAWFEQNSRAFVNICTKQDTIFICLQPKERVPCSKYEISYVNMSMCEWQKL